MKVFKRTRQRQMVYEQELEMLRAVSGHANVVRLHEERGQQVGIIVTEFYSCGDLQQIVEKHGEMQESRAAEVVHGVFAGLAHVHNLEILHRDVKPENVAIAGDGRAVLIDFGIACYISQEHMLKKRRGTIGFLAPEVILDRPYGVKSDVFSAGCVLYFLFGSRSPFWVEKESDVVTIDNTVLNDYTFGPAFNAVSDNCMDLIRRLLEPCQHARLTTGASLEHQWFVSMGAAHDKASFGKTSDQQPESFASRLVAKPPVRNVDTKVFLGRRPNINRKVAVVLDSACMSTDAAKPRNECKSAPASVHCTEHESSEPVTQARATLNARKRCVTTSVSGALSGALNDSGSVLLASPSPPEWMPRQVREASPSEAHVAAKTNARLPTTAANCSHSVVSSTLPRMPGVKAQDAQVESAELTTVTPHWESDVSIASSHAVEHESQAAGAFILPSKPWRQNSWTKSAALVNSSPWSIGLKSHELPAIAADVKRTPRAITSNLESWSN
eukprot:TRINITY_DN55196_c0_g1_i1.p1 TRINITY_DN55196_c0_g1~~TRINITY_DN55196_c0_g1_i1.p1  ORF type:complete len:557 (-),score=56.35 TRINITY_DN55196_c0_g1_i1:331-1830(-)